MAGGGVTLWRIWQDLTPEERATAIALALPDVRHVVRLCHLRWLARRLDLANRAVATPHSGRWLFAKWLRASGRLRED